MPHPPPAVRRVEKAEDLPALPGAYLLVIDLLTPMTIALPGRPAATLEPGRHVYAGSARGPGGIRARVRRHLKGAKTVRWHVDRLTNLAGARTVIALPDGDECRAVGHLLGLPEAEVPAPGFGSSDCRRCPAHLVALPDSLDPEEDPAPLAVAAGATEAVIWRRPPVACFWRPPAAPSRP